MMRNTFSSACRRAPIYAAALGSLLIPLFFVSPTFAVVKGVSVAPPEPTTCDPVAITVAGEIPDPCYEIVRATIRGPEEIPCMRPGPCPLRFQIEITVREPSPDSDRACPAVVEPYSRSFPVGRLRASNYLVAVRERVIPYGADSSDTTVSESFGNANFVVRPDSICPPGEGCYILGWIPTENRDTIPLPASLICTDSAKPGGTACLGVYLTNFGAVGGLQTAVEVWNPDGSLANRFVRATQVEAVGRARDFEVAWVAEGARTRILLYPQRPGQAIPEGGGPILRICYSIAPDTPEQVFRTVYQETIVSDVLGNAMGFCPTFARVPPGFICVSTARSCDINGDGNSDVLDIIRLVRCALASPTDTVPVCPDSTAARADCNGDGSIDIRDVICCVRNIVSMPGSPRVGTSAAASVEGNAIGFEGEVRWLNEVEGRAVLRVDAGQDWGGTQFLIDPNAAVRIRSLKLLDAAPNDHLEWAIGPTGVPRGILYAAAIGPRPARSYRIEIAFERTQTSTSSGRLDLRDVAAGTSSGDAAAISIFQASVSVPGTTSAAPQLLRARPNPTSGATEIGFVLPAPARVRLHVYDVAGRLVRTLIDSSMPEGVHRARWDGTDDRGRTARSGIYFTKLHVGSTIRSERLMLLR